MSGIFGQVDLMSKAINVSWIKNEVIADNIANVDTPNYKRKDVVFSEYLLKASEAGQSALETALETQPRIITDNQELSYRMDGNNVDIDIEMTIRAKNELYYNALINQASANFRQFNTVLNSK